MDAHQLMSSLAVSLYSWISSVAPLKMPQSVSPGVNMTVTVFFLEPFGVNWLGLDCQECRSAPYHYGLTTGSDKR